MFSGLPDLAALVPTSSDDICNAGTCAHQVPSRSSFKADITTSEGRTTSERRWHQCRQVGQPRKHGRSHFICNSSSYAHQVPSRSSFVADITTFEGWTSSDEVGTSAARSGSPENMVVAVLFATLAHMHIKFQVVPVSWPTSPHSTGELTSASWTSRHQCRQVGQPRKHARSRFICNRSLGTWRHPSSPSATTSYRPNFREVSVRCGTGVTSPW